MAVDISSGLDWNLVRTFVAVADHGSLAAAARELGLAHPTVARHVQNLEAALGLALFDRRPSGLAINEAGAGLVKAARGMLNQARAFEEASRTASSRDTGVVRITASEFLADVFPELIAPLRQAGSAVQINVELLIANRILNVQQGEADIAIRHLEPHQQDLVCRRLSGLPAGLYASHGYIAEHGMPAPGDHVQHWFIDDVRSSRVARHARRLGYPLSNDQFVFRSDSFAGRLNGAESGWGIAVVPVHVAARRPNLVRVLEDIPFTEIEMWLVGRQDVRTNPNLRDAFATAGDTLNAFVERLLTGAAPAAVSPGNVQPPRRSRSAPTVSR